MTWALALTTSLVCLVVLAVSLYLSSRQAQQLEQMREHSRKQMRLALESKGQALARNPVPIVIPCHRVIASDGGLGGYSGGSGLEAKRWLLRLEGAL